MKGSAACHFTSTTHRHFTSPATAHTVLRRANHVALRFFFVQELVEEGKIIIHFVKTQDQITGLGTKHANKHRHRALIQFTRTFEG